MSRMSDIHIEISETTPDTIRWTQTENTRFAFVGTYTIRDTPNGIGVCENIDGDDCRIAHVNRIDTALAIIRDHAGV